MTTEEMQKQIESMLPTSKQIVENLNKELDEKRERIVFNAESYWQEVRIKAAIAVLQGMTSYFGSNYSKEGVAKQSVILADALVEALKQAMKEQL